MPRSYRTLVAVPTRELKTDSQYLERMGTAFLKNNARAVQQLLTMRNFCLSKPEAKVEDYLVAGTKARGGWAAKMIDKGRRGAPDRELRFPGGKTIYVETKAKDGRLKTWQERYHKDLRALGYVVLVLWTVEQVDQFFDVFDKETPAKPICGCTAQSGCLNRTDRVCVVKWNPYSNKAALIGSGFRAETGTECTECGERLPTGCDGRYSDSQACLLFKAETPEKPVVWTCACGVINEADHCMACGRGIQGQLPETPVSLTSDEQHELMESDARRSTSKIGAKGA